MYQVPEKMSSKKKIELVGSVILILWVLLFLINYALYSQSKPLFLSIHTHTDYEDGYVDEYISLGYTYRAYNRISITKEELVPFWVVRKNPKSESDLPKPETGYNVPDNLRKLDKFRGLLYFYNIKGELLGTYKCINSSSDCEKATSGYDSYNTKGKDPLTENQLSRKIEMLYDKYAFIDDSSPQSAKYGDKVYKRTIYLYEIDEKEPKIIAKFADVKGSIYDENREVEKGDSTRYIVKSAENDKWGIVNIFDTGTIEEKLPFEYDSITYDEDTKYYILCKDGKWFVYDLNTQKTVTNESDEPIYDIWVNNNSTYYYKTGKDRTSGDSVNYSVYRMDGTQFLSDPNISLIVVRDNCIFYITDNDNVLHFMDYGRVERYKIQLAFSEMRYTYQSNPAFEIWYEKNGIINFRIYKGRDKSYSFETMTVYTNHWENNT